MHQNVTVCTHKINNCKPYNICILSTGPIYLFNILKHWFPSTVQVEDAACLYFWMIHSLALAALSPSGPACLILGCYPGSPLCPVVWLTKTMPCPELHLPILSPATTELQLWLCFDDPLQQRQQHQQRQCLLIKSNSFSQTNVGCANEWMPHCKIGPGTRGEMWDLNNFWDCGGVWRMADKLTNNTGFSNKGCSGRGWYLNSCNNEKIKIIRIWCFEAVLFWWTDEFLVWE